MNDGLLEGEVPLAGQQTFQDRNASGVWPAPPGEIQYSSNRVVDSMACVSYSDVHCVESQLLKLTGSTKSYSERFLAKMSGTTKDGNYVEKVAQTIMKYGLVEDSEWPEPDNFTWDSYYSDIPQEVIDKGQKFLEEYEVQFRSINPLQLDEALKEAPIQMLLPGHAVCLISHDQYFDTYQPYIKPAQLTGKYYQLTITPKMSQFKTQNYKGELRIVLGASTPEQWAALCAIYGVDPNHIDESV